MRSTTLTELTTADGKIRLNRVETPKGERLEIETPTSMIRLDAVALEALTWQGHDTLATLQGTDTTNHALNLDADTLDRTKLTTVSNEFGFIVAYKTRTERGIYIDIEAEKQDESIRLHPVELKTLAEQDHGLFTRWVRMDLNK